MNRLKHYMISLKKALELEVREHRSSFAVYLILRTLVILVLVRQIMMQNYENIFVCLLTLLLLLVPSFVQLTFKVELPIFLEILILVFIYAAEILGEIDNYYFSIPYWDTILHTINGFVCAAVGFSMVSLLNKSEKIQFFVSPLFLAIVSFTFSMTIGVLWEFFEFSMDQLFAMDTQKDTLITSIHSAGVDEILPPFEENDIHEVISDQGYIDIGLIDTMEDLFVNFVGATIFSLFSYFYARNKERFTFLQNFIPKKKDRNKDYLYQQIKKGVGN
ncbi:hypothetical protein PND93_10265 [Faecalicoccus pleomorphus]|uniref:hypothetical protein n=1 Tax=Faecalicoccus pleomorphus TaxID=1323 RepID=UPI00232CFD94|nr:hypothetical protein [Faecalicoccus pleomorphus]MDB7985689.1 hypothetical protein [Faecalicoccus pleomorphus]MDB7991976.1 hypothetical protein [Faecalicoccus pleomorphus]